jgi:FKBP-type peptidyl-prolyl cis-trans isomerase
MRYSFIAVSSLALAVLCSFGGQSVHAQTKAKELKTQEEKAAYFIGFSVGTNLAKQALPVDPKVIAKGIADALAGHDPAIDMQVLQAAIEEVAAKAEIIAKKKAAQVGENNKKEGAAYLAKNGKAKGVTTTKSGLQYEIIKEGKGASPKATDTVKVHYHGTHISGKVFDSSVDRGEPSEFPLNRVISGWTEGVQLMKIGSKFKFTVPSELAYGEPGRGGIEPNSLLIFEVELLSIGANGSLKK